jgi:predicted amidohydrolase
VNANVATGLVSGRTERMTHRKTIPFADELGKPPAFKEGIPHVRRPHLTVFHADRFRVGLVVCKELLDTGPLRDALDRSGVNVLLVPAMSEKTAPFCTAAAARVEAAQAITFVVNGPLRGPKGDGIAPAIVVGQPIEGRTSAGFIPRRAERVTKMPIPLPPSVPAPAAGP